MRWLGFLLLLAVVVAVGCSPPPAGKAGDANDPAFTTDLAPIDFAAEDAAYQSKVFGAPAPAEKAAPANDATKASLEPGASGEAPAPAEKEAPAEGATKAALEPGASGEAPAPAEKEAPAKEE